MDVDALFTLSYGVYVLASRKGDRVNGQISNTVMQVTDTPPQVAVAVNKTSLTHDFIVSSGVFAVTVLAESAPMKLIGLFGFKSGRDVDKFADVGCSPGVTGCPVVSDHALAYIEAKVTRTLDCGTHTVFIGEVVDAKRTAEGRPMTYAYYREVLRGKTPPTAPTYRASASAELTDKGEGSSDVKKYVCEVCGYVYDPEKGDPESGVEPGIPFEKLPDDWVCPVCGAAKSEFSAVE